MAMRPKTVDRAPCQEVVLTGGDIDLARLPVQTCWPGEPAPLITWPLVVTKGPGARREDDFNLGTYRMQVTGRDTTLMSWLKHRGGAQHHARRKQEKTEHQPDAALIGDEPATIPPPRTPEPDTHPQYQDPGPQRGIKTEYANHP